MGGGKVVGAMQTKYLPHTCLCTLPHILQALEALWGLAALFQELCWFPR